MAIEVITREDLNEFRSLLLNDLKEIIQSKPQQTKQWLKVPKDKELVEWIIYQESPEYRATTNEVLALFGWLKRFADGMIEGEEGGE